MSALLPHAVARDPGPPAGHPILDGGHSWFGTVTGIAAMTVLGLPIAALVVWALARRRRLAGTPPASAWRMSVAEVGIICGTVPLVAMTMVPGNQAGVVPSRLSLIPLQDLQTMPAFQIVGNLLIFAAAGFAAPLRFSSLASLRRIVALAAAGSVFIETAQYVLPLDRVSSVDDVLLNTAGAGLAALASRRWWRDRPSPSEPDPHEDPVSARVAPPPRRTPTAAAPPPAPGRGAGPADH